MKPGLHTSILSEKSENELREALDVLYKPARLTYWLLDSHAILRYVLSELVAAYDEMVAEKDPVGAATGRFEAALKEARSVLQNEG